MRTLKDIYAKNLQENLERFYRKFYVHRLLKGAIIAFGSVLSIFLLFDVLVFYGQLPTAVRFVLFYALILILLSAVYFGMIVPLLHLFRLQKGISNEEAAQYIGQHYQDIGDKLLNTLQFTGSTEKNELMEAYIQSRVQFFSPFDFSQAVPPLERKKNVFFLLIPLSFLLVLLVFNKRVVTEGAAQIVNYHVDYSAIAPFTFEITPGSIQIPSGETITLSVALKGEDVPNEVFVEIDETLFRTQLVNGHFQFTLENVSENTSYRFKAGTYFSPRETISVSPIPLVSQATMVAEYPDHTGRSREEFVNPSLVEIPQGTRIFWEFETQDVAETYLLVNDSSVDFSNKNTTFRYQEKVSNDVKFSVMVKGLTEEFTVGYSCQIITTTDRYPTIDVKLESDSTLSDVAYFLGQIQDDYGFSSLQANFSDGTTSWKKPISIQKSQLQQVFSFSLDKSTLAGATTVQFEVRDNDRPNNFKSTKSKVFDLIVLSDVQKDSALLAQGDELLKDMEKLRQDNALLERDIEMISKELLDKNQLDWELQQKLQKLVESEKNLQKNTEITKEKFQQHQQQFEKETLQNQQLLEKQKQLEELYEKVIDEDTKKMYEELQRLMEELNKDAIQEHLQQMEMNQEDLLEEMERNLEIFKQLEVEQGMEKALDKMDELAKKQEELAERNEKKEVSSEENIAEQEKLNKEFEQLQKELQRLDSLNGELKEPMEIDFNDALQEEIKKEQQESQENSKKGDNKKSAQNQKNAAQKMQEMQQKMEDSMNTSSAEQQTEDLESLRRLLENLLELSFNQEENMNSLKGIDRTDPQVVKLTQGQNNLMESSVMIKDSLFALAARVPQINSTINTEVKTMNTEMQNGIEELVERNLPQGNLHQQKALTAINNLAVLLDEIVQQMEQQQQEMNSKAGEGSCTKPGGGGQGKPKPSMKSSKKNQEELAKQIEKLKKELEKGNSPGKMNPGKMGNSMSKEIAEMAAQQELIRQKIREMAESLQKEGDLSGSGQLKELEQLLEQNETDLINLELDQEFYKRQREIEVKMLEAENAERQREMDPKRESQTAPQINKLADRELEEYKKKKEAELELLRLYNPQLSGYYKNQVQQYIKETVE
jgi:hypothetical protein